MGSVTWKRKSVMWMSQNWCDGPRDGCVAGGVLFGSAGAHVTLHVTLPSGYVTLSTADVTLAAAHVTLPSGAVTVPLTHVTVFGPRETWRARDAAGHHARGRSPGQQAFDRVRRAREQAVC